MVPCKLFSRDRDIELLCKPAIIEPKQFRMDMLYALLVPLNCKTVNNGHICKRIHFGNERVQVYGLRLDSCIAICMHVCRDCDFDVALFAHMFCMLIIPYIWLAV